MTQDIQDDGSNLQQTITDSVIEDWDELFSADADQFGNVRNVLFQRPDGLYIHTNYRPGEKSKIDGTITHTYSIKQTGETLHTELLMGAEQEIALTDECRNYLIGDWGSIFDAYWSSTTISLSTHLGGWRDDFDVDRLRAAGQHDITFNLVLE